MILYCTSKYLQNRHIYFFALNVSCQKSIRSYQLLNTSHHLQLLMQIQSQGKPIIKVYKEIFFVSNASKIIESNASLSGIS